MKKSIGDIKNKNTELANKIKKWAKELGFLKVGVTDGQLTHRHDFYQTWLAKNYHGKMFFMESHCHLRMYPERLYPNTSRIICVATPYLTKAAAQKKYNNSEGHIAFYALGQDYHRLIRKRLQKLADKIQEYRGPFHYRAFSDSAPILERALAEKSGIGWIGSNTNLIVEGMGSYFFLGELLVNLDLPIDSPVAQRCGRCRKCLKQCPTQAILSPRVLDARRCIAYLTIEHPGSIPEEFRSLIGNRIFGCDECQRCCPWNRRATAVVESKFGARDFWMQLSLEELFQWDEHEFLEKTKGSPIRRLGYERWLRNVAVALGNGPYSPKALSVLENRLRQASPLVEEHILWAIRKLDSCKFMQ